MPQYDEFGVLVPGSSTPASVNPPSTDGRIATSVAAGAAAAVLSAVPGRLVKVIVTSAGSTTAVTFYDNTTAGATTGNVLAVIPVGAPIGPNDYVCPAVNGISASGGAGTPAYTITVD